MNGEGGENIVTSPNHKILASTTRPSEIFSEIIGKIDGHPTSILDIGAGNARLEPMIRETFPGVPIFALDIDPAALPKSTITPKDVHRVAADALNLPLTPGSIDLAFAVNAAHEICGAPDESDRLDRFKKLVGEVATVLKPGGELVFIDGMMPEITDVSITLRPKNQDAQEQFAFFRNTYQAKGLESVKQTAAGYSLSMGDLVAFVTKILYLDSDCWDDEKSQLYPFLSLRQIQDVLKEQGFTIEELTHPVVRRNLDLLKEGYDLKGFDIASMPPVQVAIRAKLNPS